MIRGGLLVNAATLHAAERLCAQLGDSAQHLDELLHATMLDVDHAKIIKYRQLWPRAKTHRAVRRSW